MNSATVATVDVPDGESAAINPDGSFATTFRTFSITDAPEGDWQNVLHRVENYNVNVQKYEADGTLGAEIVALSSTREYDRPDTSSNFTITGASYSLANIVSSATAPSFVASRYDADNNSTATSRTASSCE